MTAVRTTDDLIDNLIANGWQAARVGLGGNVEGIEIRSASKPSDEYVLATDYYGERPPLGSGAGLLVCAYRDGDDDAVPLAEAFGDGWSVAILSSALDRWLNA